MLTEAILACRGTNLDNSDPDSEYNPSKMIEWIQKNIPHLYSMEKIKRMREKKRISQKAKKSSRFQQILNSYDSDENPLANIQGQQSGSGIVIDGSTP